MRNLVRPPGGQHGGRLRGGGIVRPPGVNHQFAVNPHPRAVIRQAWPASRHRPTPALQWFRSSAPRNVCVGKSGAGLFLPQSKSMSASVRVNAGVPDKIFVREKFRLQSRLTVRRFQPVGRGRFASSLAAPARPECYLPSRYSSLRLASAKLRIIQVQPAQQRLAGFIILMRGGVKNRQQPVAHVHKTGARRFRLPARTPTASAPDCACNAGDKPARARRIQSSGCIVRASDWPRARPDHRSRRETAIATPE